MGGKAKKNEFEDDLDFSDGADDMEDISAEDAADKPAGLSFATRSRRNWRDVERAREEREMRRLLSPVDDWMDDDFELAPRRSRG